MTEMRQLWAETANRWLEAHPVNPPKGFVLDPEEVGPGQDKADEVDHRVTWHLYNADGGCEYLFLDWGVECLEAHAVDPKVVRIERWTAGDCVWAAKRVAS